MQLVHTIFEPAGEGPHPTILAFHGWGANAQDLLGLAPYLAGGRFLVICPQGPLEVPLGPHAMGYGWFPLTMGRPPDIPAIVSARDKLRAFLDAALERYPIERKKLVALGFSQGGVMAYGLELGAAKGGSQRLNASRIEAAAANSCPARLPRRTNRDRPRARLHRDAPRPERTSHLPRIRHGARDQPQEPRRSDGVARRKGSLAADRRAVRSSVMKIGVIFPQTEIGTDPAAVRDYAHAAEGLGHAYIVAYPHVSGANPASRPGWTPPYTHKDNFHEPFVLFGYLAAATEKIGLVRGIGTLPRRHTGLRS